VANVVAAVGRGEFFAVEGVGEDADGDTAAVDAPMRAGVGGVQLRVPLGAHQATAVDSAEDRVEDLGDGGDAGVARQRRQVGGRGGDRDRLVARADVEDFGAIRAQARGRRGGHDQDRQQQGEEGEAAAAPVFCSAHGVHHWLGIDKTSSFLN
jgi:hypothetical protein